MFIARKVSGSSLRFGTENLEATRAVTDERALLTVPYERASGHSRMPSTS